MEFNNDGTYHIPYTSILNADIHESRIKKKDGGNRTFLSQIHKVTNPTQ